MNSVVEYTRQLNHQSVALPGEWLERLSRVECKPGEGSLTPEIVIIGATDIRSSGEIYSEPPVTMVEAVADLATSRAVASANSSLPTPIMASGSSTSTETSDSSRQGYLEPVDTWQDLDSLLHQVMDKSIHLQNIHDQTVSDDDPRAGDAAADVTRRAVTSLPGDHDAFSGNASVSAVIDSFQNPVDGSGPGVGNSIDDQAGQVSGVVDEQETPIREEAPRPAEQDLARSAPDNRFSRRLDYRHSSSPKSIERLVDRLVERFPPVTSSTVMLVADSPGIDVDGIAGRIATCLATRELGGILLVDANSNSRQLSAIVGGDKAPGLTNMISQSATLSGTICHTDNPNLEFLPCGTSELTHRKMDANRCAALTRELNQSFQFTVVSGGLANDTLVKNWSRYLDAVYLLVDIDQADRDRTQRTVAEFRSQGARVAGCILVQS